MLRDATDAALLTPPPPPSSRVLVCCCAVDWLWQSSPKTRGTRIIIVPKRPHLTCSSRYARGGASDAAGGSPGTATCASRLPRNANKLWAGRRGFTGSPSSKKIFFLFLWFLLQGSITHHKNVCWLFAFRSPLHHLPFFFFFLKVKGQLQPKVIFRFAANRTVLVLGSPSRIPYHCSSIYIYAK